MIVFNDILTGDGVFSDSYKYRIEDDVLMAIDAVRKKYSTGGEQFDIGANPSQEGEDDDGGSEETTFYEFDFVKDNQLEPVEIEKKDFKDYLKKFVKKVSNKIKEEKGEDAEKEFQKKMGASLKHFVTKFNSDAVLYSSNNFFFDEYERSLFVFIADDTGMKGTFYCVKDFLVEEKY